MKMRYFADFKKELPTISGPGYINEGFDRCQKVN